MNEIPDHLKKGLDILFVGFNPGMVSGETGHHYANKNNRFWRILHASGLTPRKYESSEDYKLPDLGYGLTNIVARATKAADEITKEEYREGREVLRGKIQFYQPGTVCFVGKGVYQEYTGKKKVDWGFQSNSTVPGVKDFVAPSSSGLVRMNMKEIVDIYRMLAEKHRMEKR
ncbi:mismatch-specific DNA-glycosylase [Mesobacillus zeae]|uniref:Mismatch-specific DNA-glycosylase n=1 Tax=Mesobacillus zeae TaxID=1917180 RepID=A0A398BD81_9BACI|nr:mismatch-specific DNA-glycosylase [Mesobacillus zeae]RID85616.1 mismatch-specific DNA-glycosylase [Mesobacillus zeae]